MANQVSPGHRILIVDDERLVADTTAMILERHGYLATVAYSGEQAVLLAQSLQPELLLADIVLGEMNGLETALRISSLFPACRILLFSGQLVTAEILQTAQLDGYTFDVLAKPIPPKLLLECVAGARTLD